MGDDRTDRQHRQRNPFRAWLSSPPPYALEGPHDPDYYDYAVDRFEPADSAVGYEAGRSSDVPASTTPGATPPTMSMAVLTLIIVASLSAVVGAIYLLIYFKSIKPMSARSRSYADPGKGDDDGARKSAGHPFFRRK